MQWSSEENAGFSTAKRTWLPVHEDHKTLNREVRVSYWNKIVPQDVFFVCMFMMAQAPDFPSDHLITNGYFQVIIEQQV